MTEEPGQDGRQVLAGRVLAQVVCTAVIDAPSAGTCGSSPDLNAWENAFTG